MKKIFVCGFSQESNSFNPVLTDMKQFELYGIFEGGNVPKEETCLATANGILEYMKNENADISCGVIMRAGSGGPVEHGVVEWFLKKTVSLLKDAMPVDGVAVAMHGATLSDKCDDVCGYMLESLRKVIGESVPLSAAFDLHANITEKIMKNADYVSGYQAYPHIDQKETGIRAAKRLTEALSGKGGKTVRVTIPMIASAHAYTTTKGALNELVNYAKQMIKDGEITDYTIFEVQPWLDIKEYASSVVVIAENEEKAADAAKIIVHKNFNIRKELLGEKLLTIDEVVKKALLNKSGKPIILSDSADSPNAGSAADSAAPLKYILPYRKELKCAVAVSDIPAVEKAFALGVGAVCDFKLGATKAPELSKPVSVENAEIISLHDGTFYMNGPEDKGEMRDVGKTAVLRADKIIIHVSSYGKAEGDLNFYRSFGIEPAGYDLVCVKACTSFRAGYEPFSQEICNVNTPGAASAVLTDLPFKNRPVPMYPFEEITEENISNPMCYR